MAWLAVAVFAVVVGLAAGWLLDRHTNRVYGKRFQRGSTDDRGRGRP